VYKDTIRSNLNTFNKKNCPNCNNPIEDSFNVCPICKETLKKRCTNCKELIDASWKFCPYCENTVSKGEIE